MGFDYVVFIYVTVFFGLLFAIFTGIYFEPRFFHTSNYSKQNIIIGVLFVVFTVTGLASFMVSMSDNMLIRYGIPILFAVEQFIGIILFVRYLRLTYRWLGEHRSAVTLHFNRKKFAVIPKRIVIEAIDGKPNGKDVTYWIYNKCLIAPGFHHFKFRVVVDKRGRSTYGEEELFSYETKVMLRPDGRYFIEEDLDKQCIIITPMFHEIIEYTEEEPMNEEQKGTDDSQK